MPRKRSALRNWSEYIALRTIAGAMQCFEVNQNLHTAAVVGRMVAALGEKRMIRARSNIQRCFPTWSEEKVRTTALRSVESMFQLFMVDALVTPRLVTPSSWTNFVQFRNCAEALDTFIRGEPIILLTGHCGNWELPAHVFAVIGYPVTALARPLDNPLLDEWLLGVREARGTRIVTKWGATSVVQETLRSNGRVALVADQNAGDGGLFVPFFGRFASTYKSVGLLAMRYRVPIVCGHAYRISPGLDYMLESVDMIRPDDWSDQPDPLFYITARYSRAIEKMVARAPEQYLWLHRRWKSRPHHERQGKPVPDRMIAKLESLPWMTQKDLDRIVDDSNELAAQVASENGG